MNNNEGNTYTNTEKTQTQHIQRKNYRNINTQTNTLKTLSQLCKSSKIEERLRNVWTEQLDRRGHTELGM